jgi:hypothetical protein
MSEKLLVFSHVATQYTSVKMSLMSSNRKITPLSINWIKQELSRNRTHSSTYLMVIPVLFKCLLPIKFKNSQKFQSDDWNGDATNT